MSAKHIVLFIHESTWYRSELRKNGLGCFGDLEIIGSLCFAQKLKLGSLSYTNSRREGCASSACCIILIKLVGVLGIRTFRFAQEPWHLRNSQLSNQGPLLLVGVHGIEPCTSFLSGKRSASELHTLDIF